MVVAFEKSSQTITLFHVHLAVPEAHKPCISKDICRATDHIENIDPTPGPTLHSPYRASQYYCNKYV